MKVGGWALGGVDSWSVWALVDGQLDARCFRCTHSLFSASSSSSSGKVERERVEGLSGLLFHLRIWYAIGVCSLGDHGDSGVGGVSGMAVCTCEGRVSCTRVE